jgi:2-dehydro-3-deoxygluconokinase
MTLVTVGETMLRLSPVRERLSRVDRLDVHVGGAESNVAVAAAALGLDAAWLSALPETPLGERVAHAVRGEGVTPHITWTADGRVGTYYFEPGSRPRGGTVHYDRTGTPIREVTPAELPTEPVTDAACLFTSGITPALSDRLADTTGQLLSRAREAGVRTAFDLNYRSKLWSPAEAREELTALFPVVDNLFVSVSDARTVLGCEGDAGEIARALTARHGFETVVVTRGADGALALDEDIHEQPAFETDTVDPVGSGDALVGGYLASRLQGGTVPEALEQGVATATLARTIPGDMAVLSPAEVERVRAGDDELDR